ncbi:N-acetylmuramoyl-L-alanine amidase [Cellulosilyticum sp. I15G10I2]|uniref:N-acetylmuramoyl-L-alanine amidase n=1 Tax=Cellulosilyticum sp. I15G10I2 TaxID=1892843 RepID=UPI00085BCC96|nr:N-acetylmuramoyl-L-alanine amidase [Cellulosilyticum sp. I15G10I2]
MKRKNKLLIYMLMSIVLFTMYSAPACAKENFTVCIDPGHQAKGDPKAEPIAPGSGQKKARVSSGTSGVATKKAEYKVNLEAAMILKEMLKQKGYQVVMTRETHDINISNAERAEVANKAKADMTIRLHCDSIGNSGKSGVVLLVPAKKGAHTAAIYEPSYKYAQLLKESLQTQGIKVNGIFERSDITGFNWSRVPVVIFEMGFMSNWSEDKMLSDKNYQTKLMQAATQALEVYNQSQS